MRRTSFSLCWVCAELCSAYAVYARRAVLLMLSMRGRKTQVVIFPCWLSVQHLKTISAQFTDSFQRWLSLKEIISASSLSIYITQAKFAEETFIISMLTHPKEKSFQPVEINFKKLPINSQKLPLFSEAQKSENAQMLKIWNFTYPSSRISPLWIFFGSSSEMPYLSTICLWKLLSRKLGSK